MSKWIGIRSKWKQLEQHKGSAFYWHKETFIIIIICPICSQTNHQTRTSFKQENLQPHFFISLIMIMIKLKGAFQLCHTGQQLGEAQLVSTYPHHHHHSHHRHGKHCHHCHLCHQWHYHQGPHIYSCVFCLIFNLLKSNLDRWTYRCTIQILSQKVLQFWYLFHGYSQPISL